MRKIFILFFVLPVFIAAGVLGLFWRYLDSFAETPGPSAVATDVFIEPGTNPKQVGVLLEKSGAISDARAFYYYLRFLSDSNEQLKAGDYEFAPRSTPAQIIGMMLKGKTKQIRFTIPEGSNKRDIAEILERAGFGRAEETLSLMNSAEMLEKLRAPKVSGGLEGYLFPDTYHFPRRTRVVDILTKMRNRLDEVLDQYMYERLDESGLDLNQVLTLAAIVEKETGDPLERPEIAGVFLNRLARKMKLQTDPTVIYSIPHFNGNLTRADLRFDSPYNTYVHPGLPPGPIASPGLAAIKAVLWPASTANLYFVSRNNGTHEFCPTLDCHNKAVKYWQIDFFKQKRSINSDSRLPN